MIKREVGAVEEEDAAKAVGKKAETKKKKKEKKEISVSRAQTVVNAESGVELSTAPDLPFGRLFEETTQKIILALKNHDFVILGGISGSGKSELFLHQNSFIQQRNIKTSGIVELLEQGNIPHVVLESNLVQRSLSQVEEGNTSSRLINQLINSQFILIDESMKFVQETNLTETVSKLLTYAKENGKKIIFVGGGILDGDQQNKMLAEYLSSINTAVDEEQKIEFNPTLLTEAQSVEFLMLKYFSELQASKIVKKLDKSNCPLTVRVLLGIFPPAAPGVDYDFDEFLKNMDLTMLKNSINHLRLVKNIH